MWKGVVRDVLGEGAVGKAGVGWGGRRFQESALTCPCTAAGWEAGRGGGRSARHLLGLRGASARRSERGWALGVAGVAAAKCPLSQENGFLGF